MRDAWERHQSVTVHGWIYGLKDGLLRNLGFEADETAGVKKAYETALQGL